MLVVQVREMMRALGSSKGFFLRGGHGGDLISSTITAT